MRFDADMARVICVYSWYRIYNNNVKTAEGFGTSAIAMTYNLAEWKGAFDTVSTEKSPFLNMGCTCFSWETEDGMHLLGRTYDQCGNLKGNRIAAVPRNYPLKLEINEREDRHIRSRYAFAGMAVTGLASPVMVDGINEMGVMGGLLNYPGYAAYDVVRDSRHMNIHPGFLTGYLLSQCASVEEAASILPSLNLTGERIFGQEMTVHYIFSDRTGETIIIEPDKGGLQIHRDTIGVMTNSPGYQWQQTNLCNYASVSNVLDASRDYIDVKLRGTAVSSGGGFGLPGDYSSPSRFVRMAVMKHYAIKGKDEIDGVSRMFNQFSAVNIPEGIVMREKNGDDKKEVTYDQTLCISVMCAESRTYYFSTCRSRRISALRLTGMAGKEDIAYFEFPEKEDIMYMN